MGEPLDKSIVEQEQSAGSLSGSVPSELRREFRDAGGRLWTASEAPIPPSEWNASDEETCRAGYGVGWLFFQCGDTRRRRRLYPKRWHRLSDTELERLCLFARDVSDA